MGLSELDVSLRANLLDAVSRLVDENTAGRSEMCKQFAYLLARALRELGIDAQALEGDATYGYGSGRRFKWQHAWVVAGDEVIDGNIDSVAENPAVPQQLRSHPPCPYWGARGSIPDGRRLPPTASSFRPSADDLGELEMWWEDLRMWMVGEGLIDGDQLSAEERGR
jgi:hypothetical protein